MFNERQQVGNYTLVRKLGRGGFGEVWLAEEKGKYLAIKFPYKHQVDWKQVTQEIGLWTLCGQHPNVIPLVGAKNFNGQIALISEYAADGSLEDLLKRQGKLSVEESLEIIIGILEGLQHLHENQIIHRDLKPANILLNHQTPRLTDFGISRIISSNSLSETISGTFTYMAPECFDGKRNVQTDIWSVGVILYRMLTGELPFPQKEQTALIASIIMQEPEYSYVEITEELRQILVTALAKNTTIRFQTALEMKDELKRSLDKSIESKTRKLLQKLFDENNDKKQVEKQKESLGQLSKNLLCSEVITNNSKVDDILPLIPYRKGDKWGYCDKNKNIILEPRYDKAYPFIEEMALVQINNKYGFLNKYGEEVIEIKYEDANHFSEGLALVSLEDDFGYINKNGDVIIDFIYAKGSNFSEGLAYVDDESEWNLYGGYFINPSDEVVFETRHFFISDFRDGLCCVMNDDMYGFINKEGKTVISLIYHCATPFNEGLARVVFEGKIGFINKSGNKIHEIRFSQASDFINGLALVEYEKRKFFINKIGDEIPIPFYTKYSEIEYFDSELIKVKIPTGKYLRGKFGFVNKSGEEVIPVKYDWIAYEFISNLIQVKFNDKYFYISRDGTEYFED